MNDEGIDLGVAEKDAYGISGPLSVEKPDVSRTVYPSFRYAGPTELELPDEGEMTIRFKKTSETSSTRRDGSDWYECCIEVKCICDVDDDDEPDSPTSRDTSAEDALDTIARALGKDR